MTRPKAEAVAREICVEDGAMRGEPHLCLTVQDGELLPLSDLHEAAIPIIRCALDAEYQAGRDAEREEWMTVGCAQHAAEARKAGKIEGLKEAAGIVESIDSQVDAYIAISRLIAAEEAKEDGD